MHGAIPGITALSGRNQRGGSPHSFLLEAGQASRTSVESQVTRKSSGAPAVPQKNGRRMAAVIY